MKIKTSELQGAALDWAVAKCEGHLDSIPPRVMVDFDYFSGHDPVRRHPIPDVYYKPGYQPSTDWSQGGPIIEREVISIGKHTWDANGVISWGASKSSLFQGAPFSTGQTPLIAAMRCYVASKLGDEVEVPNDLL